MNTTTDGSRADFQSLLDDWAEAIVANDTDRIDAFIEPDWVLIGPEGGPGTRERFLALVASGELTHSDMTFALLDLRVYGGVAVVLAHGTNHGVWQGIPFDADEWVTEVFVHRDGRWRCAISALTPHFGAPTSSAQRMFPRPGALPYLSVRHARKAIAWYVEVFEARQIGEPYLMSGGTIGHAEIEVGGGTIYLADEFPDMGLVGPTRGATSVSLMLPVADTDAILDRARNHGGQVEREPYNEHGGRNASLRDPFGHRWMLFQPLRPGTEATAENRT